MLTRVISGIIMISIALFATIYSPLTFAIFALIIMVIGLYEATKIIKLSDRAQSVGMAYIILSCLAMVALRQIDIMYIVFTFAVVWSCDSFAYFIGVPFGKHKMSPKISPKKSWEGFFGGVISATIIGSLILMSFTSISICGTIILSLSCAILTVLGDLLESAAKRQAKVKDSGNLIPGHGGVLDRIDGLLPVALLVFIVAMVS